MGGISQQSHTRKFFLLVSYVLIGAATSCVFLTLSLRLLPSLIGGLLILLHILTIVSSISACSSNSSSSSSSSPSMSSPKWHVVHMAATVLTAILQGAVALLIFTRTDEFLGELRSFVQEEDGVVILRMIGVLGLVMFVLEWVVLALDFVMRFYVHVEGGNIGSAKVRHDEEAVKDWPWPFQV